MNMITNIAKDVAKEMQETANPELILTTGSAIRRLYIEDNSLQENGMYLVKLHQNGTISSYSLLK